MSEYEISTDNLQTKIKKFTNLLKQREDECNRLSQNNKALEREIKDQDNYIEKIKANSNKYYTENLHVMKLYDESRKENEILLEEIKELKSKLNEYQGITDRLNNEMEVVKTQLSELYPENERLIKDNELLKSEFNKTIEDNKKYVQSSDKEKAHIELKLKFVEDDNTMMKKVITKLEKENTKLKVIYVIIQENVNQLVENIKIKNEEKRKRKESKMKEFREMIRQKNLAKSVALAICSPKNLNDTEMKNPLESFTNAKSCTS